MLETYCSVGLNPVFLRKGRVEYFVEFDVEGWVVGRSGTPFMIYGDQHSFGGVVIEPVIEAEKDVLHPCSGTQKRLGYADIIGDVRSYCKDTYNDGIL